MLTCLTPKQVFFTPKQVSFCASAPRRFSGNSFWICDAKGVCLQLVSLTRPEVISGHHTSARWCRILFTLSPNPSPNRKTAQRLRFPGAQSNKGIQRSWYYDINDVLLLKSENITLENSQLFITFKILVFLNKFVHRVKLSHKTYENM